MKSRLKKLFIDMLAFSDRFIPKSVLSGRLAYATYAKGRYENAARRVENKKGLLSLKINYKLSKLNINRFLYRWYKNDFYNES